MRRKLVFFAGAVGALLWAAALARAESRPAANAVAPVSPRPAPRPAPASKLYAPESAKTASRSAPEAIEERSLLRAAAAAHLFGSRAGRLAMTRANRPEVRAFAAGLVRHHEDAQAGMLHLLQARGMAMPMLENRHGVVLARLLKLQGNGFDREFLQAVGIDAQRLDLRALESAGQSVKDPAIKDWIERSLPDLRHQLAEAERQAAPQTRTAHGGGGAAVARDVKPVGARLSGSSNR